MTYRFSHTTDKKPQVYVAALGRHVAFGDVTPGEYATTDPLEARALAECGHPRIVADKGNPPFPEPEPDAAPEPEPEAKAEAKAPARRGAR